MKNQLFRSTALCAVCALFSIPTASAALLLSEAFDGIGDELNGKTPTTVDSAFTGIEWEASTIYSDNGDISGGNRKAVLNVGSFINDLKGQSDAIFTVSATVDPSAGGSNWISVGFYGSTAVIGDSGVQGAAGVVLFRDGDQEADGYTAVDGAGIVRDNFATGVSGAQTYGVTLDLTQWDGTGNYGTLTFNMAGISSTPYALTSDVNFAAIGIGTPSSGSGTISDFEFTQIPEPQTLALLIGAFGLLVISGFRRRN
ncbi:MAG: hypothetical protein PF795_01060 [Kiritimatiellae bacterium]|nr:hypothetical protein [Kiritimatiellia bacterium]